MTAEATPWEHGGLSLHRRAATLVVLPCSAAKAPGGAGPPRRDPTFLERLPAPLAGELAEAREADAGWAQRDKARRLPALDRYQGTLYQALGAAAAES